MTAHTPGPVHRIGRFLYQLDSPSGTGMNLWSGTLEPNNGYPVEHAERMAAMFAAAPDLLAAAKMVRGYLTGGMVTRMEAMRALSQAIARAEDRTS